MRAVRAFLAVFLVAAAAALPGPSADATDSFAFFGSGFGHGIGMSQYGALGLAQDGWGHARILTQFYTGTKVAQYDFPNSIRVGLVQGVRVVHLHARSGPVELHLGDAGGRLIGTIPNGDTWVVRTGTGHYRIVDANGKLVGGKAWGGPAKDLIATYQDRGAMVQIKESNNITYNRGHIEFNIYGSGRGRLIAVLGPQDYLYGLGEVPSEWPMQALEAQAVAARTYAFEIAQRSGQHQSWCNCAVTDDTRNQVYVAYAKEGGPSGQRWVAAVDRTAGEAVLYHGNLIQAQYASSDGGYSEDNENVWSGTALPYLRGVCDPGDYTPDNPNRVWKRSFTATEVTNRLASATGAIGAVTGFANYQRGVSGRIISVDVQGTKGKATVSGSQLEAGLGLPSDKVWINVNKNIVGPIRKKYDSVDCRPRLPQTRRIKVAGGARQDFANGSIFYDSGPGAHWLRGAVLDYFSSQGGPAGHLGFPTTDVRTNADGSTSAEFQNGTVTCPSGGGACSES